MSRLPSLAVVLIVLVVAALPAPASAATDYVFQVLIQCRAPAPFEGTITLYGLLPDGSVDYSTVLAVWTCSDMTRHVEDDIALSISDWSEFGGVGLLSFRSTAFIYPFGGCDWGVGVQILENPGYGVIFTCGPESHARDNYMRVLFFSAGDQPGFIGKP